MSVSALNFDFLEFVFNFVFVFNFYFYQMPQSHMLFALCSLLYTHHHPGTI